MKFTTRFISNFGLRILFALFVISTLGGCSTYPGWLPSDGPSRQQVMGSQDNKVVQGIHVVQVNDMVARALLTERKKALFSEAFDRSTHHSYVVGDGDVIQVSVWEAPPALLFGSAPAVPGMAVTSSQVTTFPEEMVGDAGTINIPFAGQILCAGQSLQEIEATITNRLKDKAHDPQVLVRMIRNNTDNVTVVGEVAASTRMPLTARGERLLDALAAAGGVRQPVDKMTLQVTRGDSVQSLPLATIIADPKQNIVLQPGDVITAMYQPLSFTVLGATGKNAEINFEAKGISLTQALARAGGLQDSLADARAVFIFRLEDRKALPWATPPVTTPDGKVPVVYQLNLKDPASFFVAQNFPMDDKDVMYVSNAPVAELQKFLNIIVSVIYPLVNVGTIGTLGTIRF